MLTSAGLVSDELKEELRCESRIDVFVSECWEKPSVSWEWMQCERC